MELATHLTAKREETIYFIGDIHEGAANMNEKALLKAVKIIQESGGLWIGMGDYIDAINHRDPRFNPYEISSRYKITDLDDLPNKQAQRIIDTLKPISGQCLGLLSGNHEDSYKRHNGFDVMSILCQGLDTVNLRQKAFIAIKFGHHNTYTICAAHGCGGGGMREGYPINKTYDTFRWDIADFHVQGHGHKMVTDRAEYMLMTHGTIQRKKSFYGMSGCFLSKAEVGTDGYFENKAGKESDIGMLVATIIQSHENKSNSILSLDKIYL